MSDGAIAGGVVGGILGAVFLIFLIVGLCKGFYTVREKEVIIIERFGQFKSILTAGVHFIIPWVDRPREYSVSYQVDSYGSTVNVAQTNYRISLQHEVLDFPKQNVITKDGASIHLDAVLSYQISSAAAARTMMYSIDNLPLVLSRLLQANIRNVAATLDVDQIIEDSSALNGLTQLLNDTTLRWGIRINFVKIQKIEAGSLAADLAKKKNADLTNKNTIIAAKSRKQTSLMNAEGTRDQMIKRAEGEAQKKISIANGQATALLNAVHAEANALQKMIPMLLEHNENPIRYLLSLKYLDKLSHYLRKPTITAVPVELVELWTKKFMGVEVNDFLQTPLPSK